MIKPQSNAPSDMQPWVRTTDKQIEELEKAIARLQAATSVTPVDHEQNYGINSTFTFVAEDSGTVIPYASGMNFTGDVKAASLLDVGGALTIGAPDRQELNPDTGEVIGAIPNFEMTAGQFAINPVTEEEYYTPGTLHMTDSSLDLDVNGLLSGDGLSITLANDSQSDRENIEIMTVSGDGTLASYTIENTPGTVASYVAGRSVEITGIDPAGYNSDSSIILSVDSSGTDLIFVCANETTGTYVAGGYVTIAEASSIYEGKLSVRGPGPTYYGATVSQEGLFVGEDGGNPLTAVTSITPGVISAPEVAASYLNVDGTKVYVTSVEPSAPEDGDLWIDPNGSPLGGVVAPHAVTHGAAGSDPVTLAQSQIVNLTTDLAGKANLSGATFTGDVVAQSLRSSFASAAARDAAITSPVEGMICYLEDVNQVTSYLGSAWYPIAGQMPRIELTRASAGTNFFTTGNMITLSGWTVTENRGGFSQTSGVVTVPIAGRYSITGSFGFGTANAAGYRVWNVLQGGSGNKQWRNTSAQTSSAVPMSTLSASGVKLAANDTLALQGLQNSGSSLDLYYGSGFESKFIIEYVGP